VAAGGDPEGRRRPRPVSSCPGGNRRSGGGRGGPLPRRRSPRRGPGGTPLQGRDAEIIGRGGAPRGQPPPKTGAYITLRQPPVTASTAPTAMMKTNQAKKPCLGPPCLGSALRAGNGRPSVLVRRRSPDAAAALQR